jgi:hypothetical protein
MDILKEKTLLENLLTFWNEIVWEFKRSIGNALFPFCPPEQKIFKVN